jgi:hypothetical protein
MSTSKRYQISVTVHEVTDDNNGNEAYRRVMGASNQFAVSRMQLKHARYPERMVEHLVRISMESLGSHISEQVSDDAVNHD